MKIWINGRFVEPSEARVGYFDGGFQHGIGLFETMLARGGAVMRLEEHLERLAESARALALFEQLRVEALGEAVQHCVAESGLADARIRLTVTGGDLGRPFAGANAAGGAAQTAPDPTVAIHVQPPTRYPDEFFTKGVAVRVAEARANPFDPFASHKTLAYWPRIQALRAAAAAGCAEALWFTVTNHLASGSVSSVFLAKDGALRAPIARGEEPAGARPSAVLPGCTRAAVILWAEGTGTTVERRELTIDDVLGADEMFLTNASWGVLPVVRLEKHEIGGGVPGPIARAMRERWLA
ncbi:MAG: aminotransferase class IV [Planctomycetaceae bacterium]|nr:aminotransferase class IV [Planctomycetaceae bacterium]